MNGWQLQSLCRSMNGWAKVPLDSYLVSSDKPFFEMLNEYLFRTRHLSDEEIRDFVRANYNFSITSYEPHDLMEDNAWEIYIQWKTDYSSLSLYYDTIKKSFNFIENFVINSSIDIEQYKESFAKKHIRDRTIDWSVAVHLKLVNIKSLNKADKILLKDYLKSNKIITQRLLTSSELKNLMVNEEEQMKKTIETFRQKFQQSINK